ncbi:hypothetical protein M3908_003460 [Vibrio metschnikovii]|nr:hypothetical protein [Vibrio metschnikovii]
MKQMIRFILNYFFGLFIPTRRQLNVIASVSESLENESSKLVVRQKKELDFIERHDLLKLKVDLKYARELAVDFGISQKDLEIELSKIKREYFLSHNKHLEKYLKKQHWYIDTNT